MTGKERVAPQRVDIVDGDGKLRMALFSPEHMPEITVGGKVYQGRRSGQGEAAGITFYDDDGNECGGLIFGGGSTESGHSQGLSLTFDAFMQDQVLQLFSEDEDGKRRYGMRLMDRPQRPIGEDIDEFDRIKGLPEGMEREAALRRVTSGHAQRAFFGRDDDGTVLLSLCDGRGRPRLRLEVEAGGGGRIAFLDEDGNESHSVGPQPGRR